MAALELHPIPSDKRAGEVCRLVARLVGDRRRVVVWLADHARRKILDDFLWTYDDAAFVPHVSWTLEMGAVDDPVVLVGEPANPNQADELVVADEVPPPEWARSFAVVHDLIPPGPAGEERSRWWQEWQGAGAPR